MSTAQFLLRSWHWDPVVLLVGASILFLYFYFIPDRTRSVYFVSGVVLAVLTLISPLNTLADGMLFSAHMTQHLLLLLIVPALVLLGLPENFAPRMKLNPLLSWASGVAPMWFWHIPRFCDAASTFSSVHTLQTVSLLGMGMLFWWPILAPQPSQRLLPLFGVGYLFTACLGCTALGVILTLTPVEVCSVYRVPIDRLGFLSTIHNRWSWSPERDREIGGLIMWVPMCLIYLSAIVMELARFLGSADSQPIVAQPKA